MSPREKVRSIIGTDSELKEAQLEILIALHNLCAGTEQEALIFAKKMELGINSFALNEKLLAEEMTKLNRTCKQFLEVAMYHLFNELTEMLKSNRYDLRNESACKNARMLLSVWKNTIPNYDTQEPLEAELCKVARETAKYWAIHTHRTLQQTLVRVLINYINMEKTASELYASLSEVPCIGMAFI